MLCPNRVFIGNFILRINGGLRGRVGLPRKPLRRLNDCIATTLALVVLGVNTLFLGGLHIPSKKIL